MSDKFTSRLLLPTASRLVDDSRRRRQLSQLPNDRFDQICCLQTDLVPLSTVTHTSPPETEQTSTHQADSPTILLGVPLPASPQQRLQQSSPVWVEDNSEVLKTVVKSLKMICPHLSLKSVIFKPSSYLLNKK